jgi:hypothetical protein
MEQPVNLTALRLALASSSADVATANAIVDDVRQLHREDVYDFLVAAGLEGIRHYDSKGYMLRRLHNALTARIRARERSEV